jgi:heme/copper-type cytochrome/quinol oxidase subunit 2
MQYLTRRTAGAVLFGTGALILFGPAVVRLFAGPQNAGASSSFAQEQAPNRREFTITAKDYHFSPDRLEVSQDDLVKVTVRSEDVAYSVTIDEYRVSKRVPAGGTTTLEFRADRPGTFSFYSNLTNDSRHGSTKGQLVVRPAK